MTITTEFVLRSSALPLVSIPRTLPPDEIQSTHALCLQPDVQVFSVRLDTDDGISEDDLLALDEVVEATLVGNPDDTTVYKLTVELADSVSQAFAPDFEGAELKPTTVTDEGWHETKVFADYENFNAFRKSCADHGIALDLVSISTESDSSEDEESTADGLTERQREALTLAISRGYYESPRKVTAEELAAELGISQPSLSSLLRRGERELLTSALGTRPAINTLSR